MSVTGSRHIPDDTKNKKGEWTMYREDGWVKGFYQDNLVKYECSGCGRQFILGEELVKGCTHGYPRCPYCGIRAVEWVSMTEDDQLAGMALGCIGIYMELSGENCPGDEKEENADEE